MKFFVVIIFSFCIIHGGFPQEVISGKSKKKSIILESSNSNAPIGSKIPDLVISGEKFIDENENNFIEATEKSNIKLKIQNIGSGTAKNVEVRTSLKIGREGLTIKPVMMVGNIEPDSEMEVNIPIHADMELKDGIAEFIVEVNEERGFDAFPLELKIETKEFAEPKVIVADAAFSTEDGGHLKLNYPINLKIIIQNVGQGLAKEVMANFQLPNNHCIFLGEDNRLRKEKLDRGETWQLEYLFTASRRYTKSTIPVAIYLEESFGKYAIDTVLEVGLEQNLIARNQVIISGRETTKPEIEIASLSSDIDKNIPYLKSSFPNKYALIIGNEDYTRFQSGLNSESNVEYARNDARIFREYAVNVMGIPESNAYLLLDATTGEMQQKIDLICKLAKKTGPEAEIVFYYAGHGLPEESTKEPYLIPVDVSGKNLSTAIKLKDIYRKLAETGSRKVIVFLDACFSGGGRESGLLAVRGVKVKPKSELVSGNILVLTASSGEQSALPYHKQMHGMFTYFLLKKLQETAGNITYGELAEYVKTKTSLQSLKINEKEQDPQTCISPELGETWKEWKLN